MHIFAWSPNPYAPKYRRRPMVSPVHRFQRIESTLIDSRGRFDWSHGRRGRGRRWSHHPHFSRTYDEGESAHSRPQMEASSADEESSPERLDMDTSPTSESSRLEGTLPDNFNRFRMGGWNWGLWVCFIMVTALLVPAHLYLKQYAYRGELIGIFFVVTLLFLVCFSVSMFHSKTRAILLHRLHLEEELRTCQSDSLSQNTPERRRRFSSIFRTSHPRREGSHRTVRASVSTPDLQLSGETRMGHQENVSRSISQTSRSSGVSPGWDPTGEPPPYEVAILLPTPSPDDLTRSCETPPPAYDVLQPMMQM